MTQSSPPRIVAGVIVALVLVASVALTPAPSADAETSSGQITPLGTLERVPADAVAIFGNRIIPNFYNHPANYTQDSRYLMAGTLMGFSDVRQLWQVFPFTKPDFTQATAIAVRDFETLRITHTFIIDSNLYRGTAGSSGGGEWMHAYDRGRRVFLVDGSGGIVEVDVRTFAQKRYGFLPGGATAQFAGLRLGSVTYDRYGDALIGLAGGPSSLNVLNTNTVMFQRNLGTGTVSTGVRPVGSCSGPLPSTDTGATYATPVFATENHLFVPCHRAGYVSAIVRVDRTSAFTPGSPEEVVVGPVYMETVLSDPASGRIFIVTIKGEIWAFETATMSFVGIVAAHALSASNVDVGYGIDAETGRLFFQSGTYGFGIAEGRFFPIPQALTLPDRRARGQERIVSDNQTGQVFVLEGLAYEKRRMYQIHAVGRAPAPPAVPDPDRSTVDHDEKPGVTRSRFFSSGSGYGARVVLANGFVTVVPAPTAGILAPTADIIARNINSKCGFTDRELVAGRVAKAEYDGGATAASAIAVGIDDRTQVDLARPSRCDVTLRDGQNERFSGIFSTSPVFSQFDKGPGWNRDPAACSSSEGGSAQSKAGDDHGQAPLGYSRVDCPVPGGKLEATARATLEGAVRVGRASSHVVVTRGASGVESTVLSVAQDVDIAGVIHFDEIRATATSRANGRPASGDMSRHTIAVKGVTLAGTSLCPSTCDDIGRLLLELNRATAGRAQFRVASGLDNRLRRGTPKGALTAVQKSAERQASDQALVGDFTTEVPALEMIVYNDNTQWGRARQLYQFAGVASVAGYSIALEPTGTGLPPDDDPGGEPEPDFSPAGEEGEAFSVAVPLEEYATLETGSASEAETTNPILRALRAFGRGIRLFFTDPRHAMLLFTAWGLFSLPVVLSRRRRLLARARAG